MLLRRTFLSGLAAAAVSPTKAAAQIAPWPTAAWTNDTPANQGLSDSAMTDLATYCGANASHALLVIKNGFLVKEQYWAGKSAATLFDGYSIAKSVTSMVIGAEIAAGTIPGVGSLAKDWYPALSGHKANITIEHLLNMQSGINFSNSAHYAAMMASPDFAEYVLARSMQYAPGSWWRYKADPNVLAGVIKKASGHDLWWQAQARAFNAMGITSNINWLRDPSGNANGSGDLKMTAQHFARFGYLYLRDGQWDGPQLVPASWVAETRSPTNEVFCNCWNETGRSTAGVTLQYHYGWWSVNPDLAGWAGVPADAYYAFGGGGQFVIVIPSLDLVVVRMGNGPNPYPDGGFLRDLLLKVAALPV